MKYVLAAAALTVAVPQVAWAEHPLDKVWVDLGAFRAHIDSDLRLDNETLGIQGSHVDFERDLGLDSSSWMPKANLGVRIGKRFRLEGDYFQLRRKGDITLTHNLLIDDTVFPLSADIHTDFRTNIYRVAAGYSLIRQDNAELGVSIGAHVSRATFHIQAEGPLGLGLEEHRSKSAPLPNVGLYGSVGLFGPVTLQGNVDAFKMKAGHYKGKLIDGQLALNYRFASHFGAGLGYRYAYYKITGDKHDWHGVFSYRYTGPVAYLELAY